MPTESFLSFIIHAFTIGCINQGIYKIKTETITQTQAITKILIIVLTSQLLIK
ncbi:hypothetical protein VIBNISFn118_1200017 [Vibrio nigripulchritudo SFn118]|nr:hypothetical protein VIBNISFn118_1200017 [Vibrio nigripulchritudo SFn118]